MVLSSVKEEDIEGLLNLAEVREKKKSLLKWKEKSATVAILNDCKVWWSTQITISRNRYFNSHFGGLTPFFIWRYYNPEFQHERKRKLKENFSGKMEITSGLTSVYFSRSWLYRRRSDKINDAQKQPDYLGWVLFSPWGSISSPVHRNSISHQILDNALIGFFVKRKRLQSTDSRKSSPTPRWESLLKDYHPHWL